MKKTAFCQLQIKSFDDEGIIRGIATTPTTDRAGDIVEPMGATFTLPLVLLHEHDRKAPLGHVIEATATPAGIEFVARIAKDATAGIAEVWQQVKAGLIPFVSIGCNVTESVPIATGYRFKKWEWLELSLTTVPANPEAAIRLVKTQPQEKHTMTLAEQIRSFEQQKAAAIAKMDGLVTKGAMLQGDDATAYDAAQDEVTQIDKHLARLQAAEQRQAQTAAPVSKSIAAPYIEVRDAAPKGTDFVRFTKALALSHGNPMQALEIAKGMGYGSRVETCLKAAVASGTTTSAEYSALVEPQLMASEFIELLRPALIVSKMTQVRNVPMNIKFSKATSGTSASWIGEAKPAPVTSAAFANVALGEAKLGAIAVFSEELLRRSEPSAEALVRDDLIATCANAIDIAFIDQANAGVANVKPASIANAATTAATTGTTAAAVRVDVKAAYGAAAAANQPLASAVWVMHPTTALALSMMRNVNGAREFEGIDFVTGGTFEGLPVILSTNVPGTAVAGYDVILAVQNEILLAEGGLAIDASREASLEMDSAPAGNAATPTAAQLVSLWQNGAVAIKAIRGITWARRRPTAVYRISAAKYA
ncbi:phage major capsid protein [Ferribacterium limneticum]|uniref:phage major capsid protein n=1 Tax=Ferribacterium limneticum TaxID=76259 RepID=UPI001CFAB6D3|nr:phage major capsid protein [Ferribacterium limneticum]UCV27002.1 phage major capsid protein [Ferribacterium limneticum]UCV30919.1 phage major capsid protein [Ferribacterium limneticum]